ncbi:hypothetical protein [Metamycoplasma gateae]|uniref:Lipoprotein n=1 Tax=Metamycoplasma gateae TaxID=35769 RepID=A0ABZ2AHF5_9BACT|nr:hypothetical protein V2E26_02780 [Metamycoplasma gateae]
MKNTNKRKSLFFLSSLSVAASIVAPTLISSSCSHDLPEISVSADSNKTFINEEGQLIIRGSANSFYELNSQSIFNPISIHDKKYKLFKEDGVTLNNQHEKDHVYKIKPNFDFLSFKNLTGPHDYRLFSFKYDELVANVPGVATRKKYYEHRNNPKAIFIMLYWITKTSEAAPNFESDIISPSRARFPQSRSTIEEAPWPFVRNISNELKGFWKDVTEPIVLIFEEE